MTSKTWGQGLEYETVGVSYRQLLRRHKVWSSPCNIHSTSHETLLPPQQSLRWRRWEMNYGSASVEQAGGKKDTAGSWVHAQTRDLLGENALFCTPSALRAGRSLPPDTFCLESATPKCWGWCASGPLWRGGREMFQDGLAAISQPCSQSSARSGDLALSV